MTQADLRVLLEKLGFTKQLGIGKKDFSDDELIALMARHPDLIQRPIIVRGHQAVLGRPPENVEKLL